MYFFFELLYLIWWETWLNHIQYCLCYCNALDIRNLSWFRILQADSWPEPLQGLDVSPFLQLLHWLWVCFWTQCKGMLMTCIALHNLGPGGSLGTTGLLYLEGGEVINFNIQRIPPTLTCQTVKSESVVTKLLYCVTGKEIILFHNKQKSRAGTRHFATSKGISEYTWMKIEQ